MDGLVLGTVTSSYIDNEMQVVLLDLDEIKSKSNSNNFIPNKQPSPGFAHLNYTNIYLNLFKKYIYILVLLSILLCTK